MSQTIRVANNWNIIIQFHHFWPIHLCFRLTDKLELWNDYDRFYLYVSAHWCLVESLFSAQVQPAICGLDEGSLSRNHVLPRGSLLSWGSRVPVAKDLVVSFENVIRINSVFQDRKPNLGKSFLAHSTLIESKWHLARGLHHSHYIFSPSHT